MFLSSVPVTAEAFLDREDAIRKLEDNLARLKQGAPAWLCILGSRKVGKTSLLLELARRTADPAVVFVVLDVFETLPLSLEVFRRIAIRVADGVFGPEIGVSLEAIASRPADFRSALQRSARFSALPATTRTDVLDLADHRMDDGFLRTCIDLPERLAEAAGVSILLALDEFQELGARVAGRKDGELLPLLRSLWQRHRRVAYVISGSSRTMLTELVTRPHSPFFQHFAVMELGPFPRGEAVRLLTVNAPEGRSIEPYLAGRAVDILGGHPFYLQLLGEVLTSFTPPYDDSSLKQALQELLFSRTGRLSLYFTNEFERLVGRSTFLASALQALAEEPRRLRDIAEAIQAPSGATVRYLERIADAIIHEDGLYRLVDPVFGHWLSWRRPGGTVVPMRLIGDEAERLAAERLALIGFELVYQSRASRGAFDLLATRGPHQLGVQVKHSALPVHFPADEWARMEAEGERLGWRWIVAVVAPPPDEDVILLDPAKAKKTPRGMSVGESAHIENLLLWLDKKRPLPRRDASARGRKR